MKRSNTTPKLRGGITGKGFVPGDKRINRNGRPRTFDAAREIFLSVANEEITDNQGNKRLVIEALARKWAASPEPTLQKAFMEYAFGKVPDKVETTGKDGEELKPMVIQVITPAPASPERCN